MAIPYLPTEILEQIVTHLSSLKIWRFDNARKRDLQSLRLVSRRLNDVATPFLFENLRTDVAELLTVTAFCTRHPELARYVHGLQLVMTLVPIAQELDKVCDNAVQTWKEVESQDENHANIFFDIVLEPFEEPLDRIFEEMRPTKPCLEKASGSLIALAKALPNLKHFETTHSNSWSNFFRKGAETFYRQTGRIVHSTEVDDRFLELEMAFAGILGVKIAARCRTAQSYKCDFVSLRTSSFIEVPEVTEYFSNLHTLDLGFRACLMSSLESKHFARNWIPFLNRLSNLSTLRLVLTHSMQHVHATPSSDDHELFLDDLLLDYTYEPNDQDEDDGDVLEIVEKFKLAKLKSVTFKNWAVTASGLHYFLYAHRKTLKRVHMEQMSIRISHEEDTRGWSFIARACQKHLPSLEDLRLSKLYTHERFDLGPTAPPADMAAVKVIKLHAEDCADLHRIAFSKSGDGESGVGSRVEEVTEPVSPETEWWWL